MIYLFSTKKIPGKPGIEVVCRTKYKNLPVVVAEHRYDKQILTPNMRLELIYQVKKGIERYENRKTDV